MRRAASTWKPTSLFRRSLLLTLVITAALACFAAVVALWAVRGAAETTLRAAIESDVAALKYAHDHAGQAAPIAELSAAIATRMSVSGTAEQTQQIMALLRSDGTAIISNVGSWPDAVMQGPGWYHFDASAFGLNQGPAIVRTAQIDPFFFIVIGRRATSVNALLTRFLPLLVMAVVLLGAFSIWLMRLQEQRFRTRVAGMNRDLSAFSGGNLDRRLTPSSNNDELDALTAQINHAMDELQRLVAGLDNVTRVAAHELKHELSLLARRADRVHGAEHHMFTEALARLRDLVDHVLSLSRIESTPQFSMTHFPLTEVIETSVMLYQDAFEDAKVRTAVSMPAQPVMIFGSRPLIESLIANLLSNALAAAPANTCVSVSLRDSEHSVNLEIQDEGPGVSSLDISELAQQGRRKASAASGPDSMHHGFGLSHVQAVALRHGARLTLRNIDPGLAVRVEFSITPPNPISAAGVAAAQSDHQRAANSS